MLFSCCKYVILERRSWKLPSALSKNCVSIFIYFCINICFCIKQVKKNLYLAEFAFVNVNSIFGRMLLFYEGVYVRCSEGTRKRVSPEANVSHFPFIFFNLSGFSTLLVTTCLLRLFTHGFYHGTTMIDNTKTISCTVRATYYARTDLFRRTNV